MNEILKKIDEEIETIRSIISDGASSQPYYWSLKGQLEMAQKIKDFILSQHKQLATDNNVITIGDKIRESNESLVEWYANRVNLYVCGESVTVNPLNKEKCLNYLNQPYTDTTN